MPKYRENGTPYYNYSYIRTPKAQKKKVHYTFCMYKGTCEREIKESSTGYIVKTIFPAIHGYIQGNPDIKDYTYCSKPELINNIPIDRFINSLKR